MLHKYFQKVNIHGEYKSQNSSLLVIANHFSWWDGFIIYYLNDLLFKKRFHVLMLEEQLAGRGFLNKAGAFSIKKGSRSSIESLNYCKEILETPSNMLLLFPQGEFQSLYDYPLTFEKGWQRIINENSNTEIFMVADLLDYFQNKKPILTVYIEKFDFARFKSIEKVEEEYNRFYQSAINIQKQMR